jgi:hypothetical protein
MIGALFVLSTADIAYAVTPPIGMWGDQPNTITQNSGDAFTTIDISGGVTTDAIRTYGYRFLTFELDYVYSAGTAVTMTCQSTDADSGVYRDVVGLVVSGHTLTSDQLTWSNAVAASENWAWTVSLNGYYYVKCTFTATGGGAGDTLTVRSVLGE